SSASWNRVFILAGMPASLRLTPGRFCALTEGVKHNALALSTAASAADLERFMRTSLISNERRILRMPYQANHPSFRWGSPNRVLPSGNDERSVSRDPRRGICRGKGRDTAMSWHVSLWVHLVLTR